MTTFGDIKTQTVASGRLLISCWNVRTVESRYCRQKNYRIGGNLKVFRAL
jgi:hypothetical protein